METMQLVAVCADCINRSNLAGVDPILPLRLPEGDPRSRERFLFGNGSPKGVVASWGVPDGYDIVLFDPIDVLAFLVAKKFVVSEDIQKIERANTANTEAQDDG